MNRKQAAGKYLKLRKKKHAMSEEDAWEILRSRDVAYGFLGTHGLASENDMPYVVPMNFVADQSADSVYLHTTLDAKSKRNKAIAADPNVTFVVVDPSSAIVPPDDRTACRYSMKFTSVMVFGEISKVEDADDKTDVLNLMMKQKVGGDGFDEVQEFHTAIATIYRIDVQHITGARKA